MRQQELARTWSAAPKTAGERITAAETRRARRRRGPGGSDGAPPYLRPQREEFLYQAEKPGGRKISTRAPQSSWYSASRGRGARVGKSSPFVSRGTGTGRNPLCHPATVANDLVSEISRADGFRTWSVTIVTPETISPMSTLTLQPTASSHRVSTIT